MTENELSHVILGAAIEVHRTLGGPGLLEQVYEECLCRELEARGLKVQRQVGVPILYKGHKVAKPLVLDMLVEGKVIIEVKAVEKHNPLFCSQLLTYLRLTGLKLGILVNFGEQVVKNGIHRVVNGL
ncbi:MAG TPA: GxxExxY protein [Kiritimatiellia bacterium]|nr:GxxExxY protein [Kiritimatiellia bacterium]